MFDQRRRRDGTRRDAPRPQARLTLPCHRQRECLGWPRRACFRTGTHTQLGTAGVGWLVEAGLVACLALFEMPFLHLPVEHSLLHARCTQLAHQFSPALPEPSHRPSMTVACAC